MTEGSFLSPSDPPSPRHRREGGVTMKFKLYWKHPGDGRLVCETYEQETSDPEEWCRDIIKWFNDTLRPHETKRVFVRCEIIGEVPPAEHKWFKVTAMTQATTGQRHGQFYDAMKCERCGVTGKRFGLGTYVKLDSKWRRKAYRRCDTAKAMEIDCAS